MIKRLFLLLSLFGVSLSALAADTYWQAPGYNGAIFTGKTVDGVCRSNAADYISHNTSVSYTYKDAALNSTQTSASCRVFYTNNPTVNVVTGTANLVTCPAATPYFDGAKCNATPPPPPPPSCSATDNVPDISVVVGWATGPSIGSAIAKMLFNNTDPTMNIYKQPFCVNGCTQISKGAMGPKSNTYQVQTPSPNGYYAITLDYFPVTQTGGSCSNTTGIEVQGQTVDPLRPRTEPTTPNTYNGGCPAGSVPSGQDSTGLTICKGTATQAPTASTTTTKAPTTTSTDASGNTTTTDSTTQTNADGSKTTTTTTTTTAADGTKTISVAANTTAATNGAPGTTDKPDQPKDMCTAHPELTVCQNSQVMGSCEQVTCTGDAIQCATLRAAAAMRCQQKQDTADLLASPLNAAGVAAVAGSDKAGLPTPGTASSMTVGTPDQSGWLAGGAFFADKTISFRGQTIVLPFSKAADYVVAMRYALMIVAAFVSFRILSGAIMKG